MSWPRAVLVGSLLVVFAGAGFLVLQSGRRPPQAEQLVAPPPATDNGTVPIKAQVQPPVEVARPQYSKLSIQPEERHSIANEPPAFDPSAEAEVSFALLASDTSRAAFRFLPESLAGRLVFEDGGTTELPQGRVPLALLDLGGETRAVVARELFSGRLWLYHLNGSRIVASGPIVSGSDAQPMLRAATSRSGRVLAVFYDNARLKNEVVEIALPETDASIHPRLVMQLPSLEDPAGLTYEMIPAIRFLALDDRLYVVGGTLLQEVPQSSSLPTKPWRLPGCLRAQDAAVWQGRVRVLCLANATGASQPYESANLIVQPGLSAFHLIEWSPSGDYTDEAVGGRELPFLESNGELAYAEGLERLRALFVRDLRNNHSSGVMEFGTNNLEGRVAWSQIYFLNGLMDVLTLASADDTAARLWRPLLPEIRRRLDLEIYLLDRLVATEFGFLTKAFTVARVPALFAVQTSRLLLLFNRYERMSPRGAQLSTLPNLRHLVLSLEGHIDVLATAGPDSAEPPPGGRYLYWPKGSAFYFDGLNVPYNHQNEWAYAVFDAHKDNPPQSEIEQVAFGAACDIITQFLTAVADDGAMPSSGLWPYWWGKARAGWTAQEGISTNMPAYPGDKLTAWISFRSIDVMSALAARPHIAAAESRAFKDSVARLVNAGLLFPFVAAAFDVDRGLPLPNYTAALSYARMNAPSDLQSSVYAYFALVRAP